MPTLNGVLSAGTVRSSRKHLPKDDVSADQSYEHVPADKAMNRSGLL